MSRPLVLAAAVAAVAAACVVWATSRAPTPRERHAPSAPATAAPRARPAEDAPGPAAPTADADADADGSVFAGRVLAARDGSPVAGARVRATPDDPEDPWQEETVTGAAGAFRFAGVPPKPLQVDVDPPRRAPLRVTVPIASAEVRRDLYVAEGTVLAGVVRRAGRPVAGAVLRDADAPHAATADASGAYELHGVGEGTRHLLVGAPDDPPERVEVTVPVGVERLRRDLVLGPVWTVTGRVLLDGAPAPGATVAGSRSKLDARDAATAVTGPDGTFTWRGAGPPPERVVARTADGDVGDAPAPEWTDEALRVSGRVDVHVVRSTQVRVVVTDATGRAVPGAQVVAIAAGSREDELPSVDAVCDDRGVAELRLPSGRWAFRAGADGFHLAEAEEDVQGDTAVDVPLRMQPGGTLHGRVVARDGTPLAGAAVTAHAIEREATTRADGTYTLTQLPDEERIRVRTTCPGYVSRTDYVGWDDGAADVTLSPECVLDGVVVGPDGRTPVRVFTVRLHFMATEDGEAWEDWFWPFRTETFSDADGRFELRGVEPGTIDVEVQSGALVSPVRERVRLGGDARRATVRAALAPGARVAGRVTDSSGAPLAGVLFEGGTLTWRGENDRHDVETWTDADGRYELPGLPPGDYRFSVGGVFLDGRDRDLVEARLRFPLAAGERLARDVVLYRPGRLAVRVEDAAGAEVEHSLEVRDPAGEPYFPDEGLAAGTYVLRVESEDDAFETTEVRVEVREGATVPVTVKVRRRE